jgi:hypothetical protein
MGASALFFAALWRPATRGGCWCGRGDRDMVMSLVESPAFVFFVLLGFVVLTVVAGAILFLLVRWLRRLGSRHRS